MRRVRVSTSKLPAWILALGLLLLPAARAECFKFDGTPAGPTHQPCDPDAEVSACCATNKQRPDICLSSGLCYAQETGYKGMVYSNGCTDETGTAKECPHFCPDRRDDWGGGPEVDTYNILQCNRGNKYCCRAADDEKNCCGDESDMDIGTLVLPVATGGSKKPAASDTPVDSGSGDGDTEGQAAQCPKNNTAVVGGAVGGALGAALLASLGCIAMLLLRRPKAQEEGLIDASPKSYGMVASHSNPNMVAFPPSHNAGHFPPGPPQELSSTTNVFEVSDNNNMYK